MKLMKNQEVNSINILFSLLEAALVMEAQRIMICKPLIIPAKAIIISINGKR